MSRLRRQQHPDSLELLLDTMCNTFGGIIMIALLIALLSRDTTSDAAAAQSSQTQIAQITRQISEAEKLQKALLQQNGTNAEPMFALLQERDRLKKQIEEDRATIASNTTTLASINTTNNPVEAEKLSTIIKAQTERSRALAAQIQRETESHQRAMRLPRERVTGKKAYYFVVRFGRIYPVFLMRDGQRERNTDMLDWQVTDEGESATPKPGAGLDLNSFARSLNEIPAQMYSIQFAVYNDSFPAFIAARQIPLARNFDTGWEFLTTDRPIVFSARGEAPPAL
jgi:hypothetical protein